MKVVIFVSPSHLPLLPQEIFWYSFLGGPGSNSGEDEIFHLFRPVLGPNQPPRKWVPSLSRE